MRDTARWGGRMTRQAFGSSMFELADIWTENIDEEEVRLTFRNTFVFDSRGKLDYSYTVCNSEVLHPDFSKLSHQ